MKKQSIVPITDEQEFSPTRKDLADSLTVEIYSELEPHILPNKALQ